MVQVTLLRRTLTSSP